MTIHVCRPVMFMAFLYMLMSSLVMKYRNLKVKTEILQRPEPARTCIKKKFCKTNEDRTTMDTSQKYKYKHQRTSNKNTIWNKDKNAFCKRLKNPSKNTQDHVTKTLFYRQKQQRIANKNTFWNCQRNFATKPIFAIFKAIMNKSKFY